MPLIDLNLKPDDKTVRDFGWISAGACIILAVILYFTGKLPAGICLSIVGFGIITWISSIVWLAVTRWIYITLTVVTFPIGMVVSFIVLAIFYYLIITPTGIIFRLIGRDILCRKWPCNQESYWIKHKKTDDIERYFRQF